MASNLVVARGGVEFVPPISLAFWRWTLVFLILLPFTYVTLKNNFHIIKKEYKKLFFLGSMGCGVCGAFPFLAGETTTVTNMGIIYTSSPVFIILISYFFFQEKINWSKLIIDLVKVLKMNKSKFNSYRVYYSFLSKLAKELTSFYYKKLDKPFKVINKAKRKGYDPVTLADRKFEKW